MREDLQRAVDSGKALCVGLDPSHHQLDLWGLSRDVAGLQAFSDICLDAVQGVASIVKPQVAFFEQHGWAGLKILEKLISSLRSMNVFVIADAKRGDIGSTMSGYVHSWLSNPSSSANALTVHSYLGMDVIAEVANAAPVAPNQGFFALCATSNSEGAVIQQARVGNSTLARFVFDEAERISANTECQVGVVIGATLNLEDYGLADLRKRPSEVFILAPGFGAQGAKLDDLADKFGSSSNMVIPSMSRELLGSDWRTFRDRIEAAKAVLL